MRRLFALLLAFVLIAAACGGGDDDTAADVATDDADTTEAEAEDEPDPEPEPEPEEEPEPEPEEEPEPQEEPADENPLGALRVPQDYATIQEAVDAAVEGDLILIDEGVYHESVAVETDNIVIRGVDRHTVVLDGEHKEEMANGIIVFGNGVAVENLTVQNYFSNGVFFTGDYDSDFILQGYRVSHVNALNNRKYGIYAFNAEYGVVENNYAAGQTDSGYYIGQCQPCRVLLHNNISENNTLGYSGTNAGGELYIVNNEFANNRAGIVPNTLDGEELAPQRTGVFAGNWVYGTGNPETPFGQDIWDLMFGIGIVLPGANDNLVTRNLVEDNSMIGIAISFLPDENLWYAERNTVTDNVFRNNMIDAVLIGQGLEDPTAGNCFENNELTSSSPADIQTVAACGNPASVIDDLPGLDLVAPPEGGHPRIDYTEVAAPMLADQPSMPDALTAPPVAADSLPAFDTFDLDAVTLPTGN